MDPDRAGPSWVRLLVEGVRIAPGEEVHHDFAMTDRTVPEHADEGGVLGTLVVPAGLQLGELTDERSVVLEAHPQAVPRAAAVPDRSASVLGGVSPELGEPEGDLARAVLLLADDLLEAIGELGIGGPVGVLFELPGEPRTGSLDLEKSVRGELVRALEPGHRGRVSDGSRRSQG